MNILRNKAGKILNVLTHFINLSSFVLMGYLVDSGLEIVKAAFLSLLINYLSFVVVSFLVSVAVVLLNHELVD